MPRTPAQKRLFSESFSRNSDDDAIRHRSKVKRTGDLVDYVLPTGDLVDFLLPTGGAGAGPAGGMEMVPWSTHFPPSRDRALELDFEIIEKIGEGGFSQVLKVREKTTGQLIADKMITAKKEKDAIRIEREINLLQGCKHDNIIRLLDSFTIGAHAHLMLELCDTDVYKMYALHESKNRKSLLPEHIKHIMLGIAQGLKHLHEKQIAHRDIKPENILLTSTGQIKITDFGLARCLLDPEAPPEGRIRHLTAGLGTIGYRAPEMMLKEKDYGVKVDIWSLGSIGYELFSDASIINPYLPVAGRLEELQKLCGDMPDGPADLTRGNPRVIKEYFSVNSKADADAAALMDRLLMWRPSERPSSADVVEDAYFLAKPSPVPPIIINRNDGWGCTIL